MKKILLISGDYPPIKGGVSDYTKILFNKLCKKLINKKVFLITSKMKSKKKSQKNIYPVIKKWNFMGTLKCLHIAKKKKPDIIHIQYPASQYKFNFSINLLPLFLRLFRPKTIIISTLHEFTNRSLSGKIRLSLNTIFSHKTLVVSKKYKEDILNFLLPIKRHLKNKITYIPIGSNISAYKIAKEEVKKTREQITENKNTIILCNFGKIRPNKGIEALIDAFEQLIKERKNIQLLFIGEDKSQYCLKIKNVIKDKKLESKVKFTGYISTQAVSKYLFASDICVLPFKNGLSTKRGSFLAPLFHNLPIITTKPSPNLKQFINYKNIVLINNQNRKEIKEAISKLIQDKYLRDKIKKNIPQLKQYFKWDKIIKKIISVYYELSQKK